MYKNKLMERKEKGVWNNNLNEEYVGNQLKNIILMI